MKVWTKSQIGTDGIQDITVMAKEPNINKNQLYENGIFYSFQINHRKQTTELYKYSYSNGVPVGFDKRLMNWKDEILTAEECLEYCEKM